MPLLDVTDLTFDPDFADVFSVVRRKETVGADGRPAISEQTFKRVYGVVTMAGNNSLSRQSDYQVTPRSISVVTRFAVQGEVTGYQPDIITWRNQRHLVVTAEPYPQFGRGFYQVECTAMTNTEAPV